MEQCPPAHFASKMAEKRKTQEREEIRRQKMKTESRRKKRKVNDYSTEISLFFEAQKRKNPHKQQPVGNRRT